MNPVRPPRGANGMAASTAKRRKQKGLKRVLKSGESRPRSLARARESAWLERQHRSADKRVAKRCCMGLPVLLRHGARVRRAQRQLFAFELSDDQRRARQHLKHAIVAG